MVNIGNGLRNNVVLNDTVNTFKTRFYIFWQQQSMSMISRQKCMEPEVEVYSRQN